MPIDEADRLQALACYEILDTPPDPRFDVFARIAADLYSVPISVISLIDEHRQWFKAGVGLDITETSRELAFCAHAILAPSEVMVVEDARQDSRFTDNALVTGAPGIRFYAGAPIVSPEGHALGTLCIIDCAPRSLDISGRQRLADLATGVGALLEAHRSAIHSHRVATQDPLTGLANRLLFDPRLDLAAQGAQSGPVCAVLCLDLDRFKAVNDQFGHAGGDTVLRAAGARLLGAIRPCDLAARLGGDEFAVLLQGPFDREAPRALAARLINALAAPLRLHGQDTSICASIGFAVAPSDGADGPTLLRAADVALFRAKDAGRGVIVGYQDALPLPFVQTNTLLDELREAIDAGTFTLDWQPYFDLRSDRVRGHEALIRWHRPRHGLVSPDVFIPVAETSGVIHKLDAWVLEQACREAAMWPAAQTLSVNITPSTFCTADLPYMVSNVLTRTGLAPDRLALEITERTTIDRPDLVRERIDELHRLGVQIALDDLGSGYSALGHLKEFNFDTVKLDRSFIRDIGHSTRSEAIARALIQLGHAIGMTICAEGIETEAQLAFLRSNGCDLAQGFLLGRPTRVPQFAASQAPAQGEPT